MEENQPQNPPAEQLTGNSHPTIEAHEAGDLQTLHNIFKELELKEKPMHTSNHSGWQAVHFAAELPDTSCLAALLEEEESSAGSLTHQNKTPLIVAAASANVNAVKVLLPWLDTQDVFLEDSDGLNAFYYAVKADSSNGNKIALMLLEMNSDISQNVSSSILEAIPYRVVMNRNRVLLEEILKLGLDPRYHYHPVTRFGCPCTLAGFCVDKDWSEGLELVIAAEKKRHILLKGYCSSMDICELLCPSKFEVRDRSSAWLQVFKSGSLACFEAMMKEGMTLRYIMNMIDEGGSRFEVDLLAETPNCYRSPLTLLLETDMWKNQTLLKMLLQLESCQEFNNHHKEDVMACDICSRWFAEHLALFGRNHPLVAAVHAILDSKEEHSVDESIQMLIDHGFTFDFDIACIIGGKFGWICSITSLLLWLTGCCSYHLGFEEVAVKLLESSINLPVTTYAIALACEISVEYPECPALNHLSMMRHIARGPLLEIEQAYERMYVTGHIITTTRHFEDERPDQIQHTAVHDWFVLAQLLLKGVRADNIGEPASYIPRNRKVPFSALMLNDADRYVLFGGRFCGRRVADRRDPYELSLAAQRISSLQNLCRKVIRDQIGFSRLIREPVPRCVCTAPKPAENDSSMGAPRQPVRCACSPYEPVPRCVCKNCCHTLRHVCVPDEIVVEEGWEISSIEQLPISNSLKDFLRYKPDLRGYCEYLLCTDFTMYLNY